MSNRLVAFLYLLMRDELATGKVENLIKESEKVIGIRPMFSSVYLENYARQLAERLRE